MSATAQLALDVRGFLAGMDLAKQGLTSLRAESSKVDEGNGMARLQVAAVGLAATLGALAVSVYKGVQATIQVGAVMVDTSHYVGLAVQSIGILGRSLEEVGGKADEVAPSTQKFNQGLRDAVNNTGPLVGILKDAGLQMEDLAKLSVAQRMVLVAEAIRKIEHPTKQAHAAVAAFGSEGVKMIAALDPKNLNSAAAAMGAQAQIMQANAGVFARIMQLMGAQGSSLNSLAVAVKGKLQGLFTGIAAGVAPTLLKIMEASSSGGMSLAESIRQFSPALAPLADLVQKLVALDLAGFGQQLGLGAGAIISALKNGDALTFIKNGLQIAAIQFRTLLTQAVVGIEASFAELTNKVDFEALKAPLQMMISGAGDILAGSLQLGLARAIEEFQSFKDSFKIFEGGTGNLSESLKFFADGFESIANIFVGTIKSGIATAIASIKEGLGVFGKAIPKTISVALEKSGQADIAKGKDALLASAKNAGDAVTAAVDKIALGFDPAKLREAGAAKLERGKGELKTGAVDLKDAGGMIGSQVASNFQRAGAAFVQASAKVGEAAKPDLEMLSDAQTFIAQKSLADARQTQKEMQSKFATPAATPQDLTKPAKTAVAEPVGAIVSSMAKIGGDQGAAQTSAVDYARQQLQAQQRTAENTARMVEKLNKLQPASSMTGAIYQ